MSISSSPMRVRFDENSFWVDMSDGRVIGVPLAWFPHRFTYAVNPQAGPRPSGFHPVEVSNCHFVRV